MIRVYFVSEFHAHHYATNVIKKKNLINTQIYSLIQYPTNWDLK